jgi:hypothetical protein
MARQLSRARNSRHHDDPHLSPSSISFLIPIAYTYGLLPISPDHRRESSVFEREWWTLGRAAGRVEPCRQFQNVRDRAYWLTGSVHQTHANHDSGDHPSERRCRSAPERGGPQRARVNHLGLLFTDRDRCCCWRIYGEPEASYRTLPRGSQETLAEMAGTTRSRVNFCMNKFRKLGFIEYNGVHTSRLSVVLRLNGRPYDATSRCVIAMLVTTRGAESARE